ncbi:MAG: type IX secretion system membrane protein PorP/SprF, partial [Cyclobacteriaceae bacterium]|nr:type IX secretion system membrane protein PorP/SprF [Cyclobacteriaceae bacterium]
MKPSAVISGATLLPSHKADCNGRPCCTLLVFVFIVTQFSFTHAQQDPLYSQYIFNPFIINPAYAGFSKDLTALAAYRVQWAGFNGSPVTMNATGHMALHDNRMGLGLTLLQDKIGTNKTTEVLASYAYHVEMSKGSRLSFGLQAGVVNYRNDFDELTIDRSDPKFQNSISELSPSFGAGIIFSSDKLFLSLAVPKMLDGKTTTSDNIDVVLYSQQFYGMGSYLFTLSHRLKLKPYVLTRLTAGAPASTDFGVALNADDSYTLGLFTRNLHTYGAMMKINLGDMLRLGYIFELPTNKSIGLNYTAHEITLGIR